MADEREDGGVAGGNPVKTLAKGLAILDILRLEGIARTGDIAERIGVDKSGASRLLQTLAVAGYAERIGRRGFRSGPKLDALRGLAPGAVKRRARPLLVRLAEEIGECAYLGIPADEQVLYLDKADIVAPLKVDHPVGTLAPLDRTALGKVLLAFGCAAIPGDALAGPKALQDSLKRDLERVLATGIAIDDEERAPGIRCVAAPLRERDGHVVGAIAVAGPSLRIPRERLDELGRTVSAIAGAFATADADGTVTAFDDPPLGFP
ncbi:IclR family transcriptional regulator [Azospirillum endophyticum]